MKYLVSLERYEGDSDERPRRMFATAKEARAWVEKMEGVYSASLYVLNKRGDFRKMDTWDEGWRSSSKIRIPKSSEIEKGIERSGYTYPRDFAEKWWQHMLQRPDYAGLGGGAFGRPKEDEWPDVIDG